MYKKNLLNWLALILILPSCSETLPSISVVCEENNIGNSIIKWETAPFMKGQVKVYASTHPEMILEDTPIATGNIADEKMTIAPADPSQRYYYLMVFNDKHRVRVATRNINIPGIQDFRDLGGYKSSATSQKVRWGKLYRSAQIDSIDECSFRELKNIGIRTIVDLRSKEELKNYPKLQEGFHVVHIPIATGNMDELLLNIQRGNVKCDTVYRAVEQMNRKLINSHQKEFKQIFEILLDSNNYPAIIHCSSGKGRAGVASALILAALDVNEDIIMQDYRLSNDYFNIPNESKYAYQLPSNSQEAITTLFSAKEDFLNAAKAEAERMYGDIPTYLEKALGLNKEKIKRLRNILLE